MSNETFFLYVKYVLDNFVRSCGVPRVVHKREKKGVERNSSRAYQRWQMYIYISLPRRFGVPPLGSPAQGSRSLKRHLRKRRKVQFEGISGEYSRLPGCRRAVAELSQPRVNAHDAFSHLRAPSHREPQGIIIIPLFITALACLRAPRTFPSSFLPAGRQLVNHSRDIRVSPSCKSAITISAL